jgi:hypothetical protein
MRGTRGVKAGESGSYGTLCMIDLRNVLRELLHPGKRYRLLPKSRRFRREGPRRLKKPGTVRGAHRCVIRCSQLPPALRVRGDVSRRLVPAPVCPTDDRLQASVELHGGRRSVRREADDPGRFRTRRAGRSGVRAHRHECGRADSLIGFFRRPRRQSSAPDNRREIANERRRT